MADWIERGLKHLFNEHRLVFWYDADRDMRSEFEGVDLPDVTKLEIANNEFGLKYRVLRNEPSGKFLLFKNGPAPADADDWLLDIRLATTEFKADRTALILANLGLPSRFSELIRDHATFFEAKTRVEALKRAVGVGEVGKQELLQRMLAVCAGVDGGLDSTIEALLQELASEKGGALHLIGRSELTTLLWTEIKRNYGYSHEQPDFEDFAISLFHNAYLRGLNVVGSLNNEALVAFRRWVNNKNSSKAFEALSRRFYEVLPIKDDITSWKIGDLVLVDQFEEVDCETIRRLVRGMADSSLSAVDVLGWLPLRSKSHWYAKYKDIYEAIGYAAKFQQLMAKSDFRISNLSEGVRRYVSDWHLIDQHYRKYVHHMRKSGQQDALLALTEMIENRYATHFVKPLNDAWQDQIAQITKWEVPGYLQQREFYRKHPAEFRRKDQKVVVIISDALRYEAGEECLRAIQALNRVDAELSPMIASLPSYTQLGMASLLPHGTLSFDDGGNAEVLANGESTKGLLAREKQLSRGRAGDIAKTLRYDDAISMSTEDSAVLFRDHHVVYIYHNWIDAIGDKISTEEQLPEAVAKTVEDLTRLVHKLTAANFSNIVITADHGFLYQNGELDESDFLIAEPSGGEVLFRNRRFLIGRRLPVTAGMKRFASSDIGLDGDLDVLIPNSINRLRVKGAGSRFVHGGATLQEIVIPVIRVGKKRESDVRQVDVEILVSGRSQITSGQIALRLYQKEPCSEKVTPRKLVAGIFASDGTLISEEHAEVFDKRSENAREREIPVKFLLSRDAERFNNQGVFLKLRERVGETARFKDYASHRFDLRRGMTTDFDF